MGTHSREELREMARTVVEAENSFDTRPLELYLTMSLRTGLDPEEVRARIHAMAAEPLDEHA